MIRSRSIYGASLILNYHTVRSPRKRDYRATRERVVSAGKIERTPTLDELDQLDRAFESRALNTERALGDGSWWDTK